ncbi:MAG TPA: CpaF family protein [Gemmatimonadaceae bacterium]|nr:CpaF family protein [Gemmatimonadaceae bacterium]
MPISLRDRLLGKSGATPPQPTEPPAPDGNGAAAATPPRPATPTYAQAVGNGGAAPRVGSELPVPVGGASVSVPKIGMYAKRAEEAAISAVDQLKVDLHRRLVERLDLTALERITDPQVLVAQIRQAVTDFLRTEQAPLSAAERDEIVEQIIYEVTGLGPIEPLVRDNSISDILVNGPKDVYIERRGKLVRTRITFRDNAHLMAVIDRIVSRVGRRVDESSPMVDARLPDGSRVNAIIPPLALDGAVLSIRRFGAELTASQLVENGALTEEMLMVIAGCVRARLNILISGGTGAGKTTLLNAMSSFIPDEERIVTIEDAAELKLQQDHVVRLETRPPNAESRGEVVARDLVKNALRMRPDRIIVGEVRGAEALDMLQAMNTGHEGSLTTIHANSPRDALARLETMILFAGTNLPNRAMREQISSALDAIVQVSRMADGSRRITSITEITHMEGDIITAQEIFRYRRRGIATDGTVVGNFEATGVRPTFLDRLKVRGIDIPTSIFGSF